MNLPTLTATQLGIPLASTFLTDGTFEFKSDCQVATAIASVILPPHDDSVTKQQLAYELIKQSRLGSAFMQPPLPESVMPIDEHFRRVVLPIFASRAYGSFDDDFKSVSQAKLHAQLWLNKDMTAMPVAAMIASGLISDPALARGVLDSVNTDICRIKEKWTHLLMKNGASNRPTYNRDYRKQDIIEKAGVYVVYVAVSAFVACIAPLLVGGAILEGGLFLRQRSARRKTLRTLADIRTGLDAQYKLLHDHKEALSVTTDLSPDLSRPELRVERLQDDAENADIVTIRFDDDIPFAFNMNGFGEIDPDMSQQKYVLVKGPDGELDFRVGFVDQVSTLILPNDVRLESVVAAGDIILDDDWGIALGGINGGFQFGAQGVEKLPEGFTAADVTGTEFAARHLKNLLGNEYGVSMVTEVK